MITAFFEREWDGWLGRRTKLEQWLICAPMGVSLLLFGGLALLGRSTFGVGWLLAAVPFTWGVYLAFALRFAWRPPASIPEDSGTARRAGMRDGLLLHGAFFEIWYALHPTYSEITDLEGPLCPKHMLKLRLTPRDRNSVGWMCDLCNAFVSDRYHDSLGFTTAARELAKSYLRLGKLPMSAQPGLRTPSD